jgi:hypothetical protein
VSPGNYHHASTNLKSSGFERIGLSELSLPTGCAAVAAAAAAAAATFTDGNVTPNNPNPEGIFVILVHVMFAIFQ